MAAIEGCIRWEREPVGFGAAVRDVIIVVGGWKIVVYVSYCCGCRVAKVLRNKVKEARRSSIR